MSNFRRWIILCEAEETAADTFIAEAKNLLQQLGEHVNVLLTSHAPTVVEIDSITAEPMQAGWGTKALKLLCDLADEHHITLMLEVDDDDDDSEDDRPSADILINLYSRFDFEIIPNERHYDRTAMVRQPFGGGSISPSGSA